MNLYMRMNVHNRAVSKVGYRVAWLASQHDMNAIAARRWSKLNIPTDLDKAYVLADIHTRAEARAAQWRGTYRLRMMTVWQKILLFSAGGLAALGAIGWMRYRRHS